MSNIVLNVQLMFTEVTGMFPVPTEMFIFYFSCLGEWV